MMSLAKPSREAMDLILAESQYADLSYQFEGCTSESVTPSGFNRDSTRRLMGTGQQVWNAAVESLEQWQVMPTNMVEVVNAGPIEKGRVVGVLFRGLGAWSFNPCRILKLHNETSEFKSTFGFTYGTLPGHVEKGEERFLLVWDHKSDEVWYELEVVSKPEHFLARLVYPYARMQQAKFRHRSCKSMYDSVLMKTAPC